MSMMGDWLAAVCAELELELVDLDATTKRVLELTADVAHEVARPAAPMTAFLVGLAAGAGAGADPEVTTARLTARLGELAKSWSARAGS